MHKLDYNLALLAAAGICFLIVRGHRWWQSNRSSPPAPDKPMAGVKSQAKACVTPPVTPGEGAVGENYGTVVIDRWAADQPGGTNAIIRRGTRELGVSESTIKRALRRIRKGRQ